MDQSKLTSSWTFLRDTRSRSIVLCRFCRSYMKHLEEPLTVFLQNEQLGSSDAGNSVLGESASFGFLEALFTRLRNTQDTGNQNEWLNTSIDGLLSTVRTARETFQSRVRLLRVALQAILLIRTFMISEGYEVEATLPELMCGAMRGRIQNVTKYLCTMVKKLRKEQINKLLPELRNFFASLPDNVREAEKAISSRTLCGPRLTHRFLSNACIVTLLRAWGI